MCSHFCSELKWTMNTGQSQPAHTNHKSLKQHTTNSHSHTPPCHPYSIPHHVDVTHTAPTITHTPHHVTHTAHPITHTPRPVTCTLHSTVNTCTDKHDNWTQLSLDQYHFPSHPKRTHRKIFIFVGECSDDCMAPYVCIPITSTSTCGVNKGKHGVYSL